MSRFHAFLHLADRLGEAHEDSAADDAMPDIEFFHPRNSGDGAHIQVVETMSGVELQPAGDDRVDLLDRPTRAAGDVLPGMLAEIGPAVAIDPGHCRQPAG